MKERKRLEITLETHELTIVRFKRSHETDFCRTCRAHTPHLAVAECVSVLGLPESEIFRLAQNGQIHSRETTDGFLRLCGSSLAEFEQSNKE